MPLLRMRQFDETKQKHRHFTKASECGDYEIRPLDYSLALEGL